MFGTAPHSTCRKHTRSVCGRGTHTGTHMPVTFGAKHQLGKRTKARSPTRPEERSRALPRPCPVQLSRCVR